MQQYPATELLQSKIDFLTKKLEYMDRIAKTVTQSNHIKENTQTLLQSLLEYYQADSTYVFEIDYEEKSITNMCELYANNIDIKPRHTDTLPFSPLTIWHEKWEKNRPIYIPDVTEFQTENPDLVEPYSTIIKNKHIHSIITMPLFINNDLVGFVGANNPQLPNNDINFIITTGHYIALQLDWQQQEKEHYRQYLKMEAFLDALSTICLFTAQINLTKNFIENIRGTDVFIGTVEHMPYTDLVNLIGSHMNKKDCLTFNQTFAIPSLLNAYAVGKNAIKSDFVYLNDAEKLVRSTMTAVLIQHPGTGDIIAFFSQSDTTREKIRNKLLTEVLSHEYDCIMCIDGKKNTATLIRSNRQLKDYLALHDSDNHMETARIYAEKYLQYEDRQTFLDFVNPENVWKKLESQDSCSISYCIYIQGKPYYKKLNYYCINHEYQLLLLVRTDYTEIQQLKQQQENKLIRALATAEKVSTAKNNFLSRISHDIRTALSSIIGMTQLAQANNTDSITASYLDKIAISNTFLLDLVNDIIDFSKIDSDELVLNPEPYSESYFISFASSIIQPLCAVKKIDFQLYPPDTTHWILVDKLRYEQIFFHILSYIIHVTSSNDAISLAITNNIENTKLRITTTIHSNGSGIDEKLLKQSFISSQLHSNQVDHYSNSSNLSLSIAYQLVKLMKGTVTVKKQTDKGTTLTICIKLPLAKIPSPVSTHPSVSINLSGYHILIAEDDEINADFLRILLESKGSKVTIVNNGKSAVDVFKKSRPFTYSAILMDIRMPIMNGITATKRIRNLNRSDSQSIPIIATTANAYGEDIKACLEAGMNCHMTKPIEKDTLYKILSCYLI